MTLSAPRSAVHADMFELERRSQELEALYEASRDLSAQTDVDSLLKTLMERVTALLGCSSTSVFLYDSKTREVEVAGTLRGFLQVGTRFGMNQGITGRVAQTGQPIIVDDYQTWEHRIAAHASHGVRAILVVPMTCAGELIGALGVSEYAPDRTYSHADACVLSMFAAHAAGALRSVQVLEDAREKTAALLHDNDERRRIEELLRRSEERYRSLVEDMNDVVFTMGFDGVVTYISPVLERLSGHTPEDMMGRSFAEFIHPEDLPGLFEGFEKVLAGGIQPLEFRVFAKNGDLRWVRSSSRRNVEDGVTTGITGSLTDIHERKSAELALIESEVALRASEERYRELVENANDLVYVHDLAGNFLAINRAAERAVGYSRAEALVRNLADIIVPEDRPIVFELTRQVSMGEEPPTALEIDVLTKDGRRITLEISPRPIFRDGVPVAVQGVARDVSERKRAAAEIRLLNEALEQRVQERTVELAAANKELEAFGYSVSHDLRGPLRVIEGYSHLLLDEYGESLDEIARRYIEGVRGSSRRMAQLIQDLLDLSRITRNAIERRPVDLTPLVHAAAAELRRTDPDRSVEFVVPEHAPASGDRSMLRIVVENLIGNAWKYTGRHASARIEFGCRQQDGEVVYFVRDDGAGFDMDYVDKLFRPFQRLHLVSEFEGTGIGLATIERIVQRHGGRVWAEGAVEIGATFYFTLAPAKTT